MSGENTGSEPRAPRLLSDAFFDLYPGEAAATLESAPVDEIARFLGETGGARAAGILDRLSPTLAAQCLAALERGFAAGVLASLDAPRGAMLLGQMAEAEREDLLASLEGRAARALRELLSYPPDTAGQLMDARFLALGPDLAVSEALARVRAVGRKRTQHIWVVDEGGKLLGRLGLAEAVLADPSERLGEVATTTIAGVHAMAPREEVVEALTRTRADALPVLDLDERLLGIIRADALVRAVQEEATADLQTMVGVSKDERALSSPLFSVRKRLPWLNINLLTAFLAAAVVGLFESTIAQFTALAVLLPVVAGQSGNTGAQALAVTMRGLALREVRLAHARRVLIKETAVGAMNGVAVAVVTAVGVYFWSGSPGLCFVIGLAMVISMILAGLSGAAIPLVLSAMRQDPAQSGSIILTTVTDVTGFFSFLGLATLFSGML